MSKRGPRRPWWLLLVAVLALAGPRVAGWEASAQDQPRLSRLDVAIWPEFDEPPNWTDVDRPPALVIIRAELSSDTLPEEGPARLSLRIPAAAGRPYAVATSTDPGAGLVNQEYETAVEGDSLRITLRTEEPVVHVEFYLPLARDGFRRDITYVWPGDLAADSVTLRVQVPVGAENLQTEPEMGPAETGDLGLLYRETDLGALEAGQALSFRVAYDKQDPRFTIDTIPDTDSLPEPAAGGDDGVPLPWPVLAAMAAVLLMGIAVVIWYRSYQGRPAPIGRTAARHCTQCGRALSVEDRFCSRCGTPVRKE